MAMNKISPSIIFILAMALALTTNLSSAQDSPQDYVDAHNSARAQVNVGPISWDANVAAYALDYANKRKGDCSLIHSNGPYGENLGWDSGYASGKAVVDRWVNKEKPYYDYKSNQCATGHTCGHYTQVVWRNSARVGCAKVRCNTGATFTICSYDPPGNVNGQRPY